MRDWDDIEAELNAAFNIADPFSSRRASIEERFDQMSQPEKPSLFDRFMNSGPGRKVKQNLDENPAAVLLGAAACITAAAKLIDVTSSIPSKRAYAKATNARLKK